MSRRAERRGRAGGLLGLAFVALLALHCEAASQSASRAQPLAVENPPAVEEASVTIRGTRVDVDVARSRAAQQLGLGRYRSLAWGRGMIFPYTTASFQTFWMQGMHFDIDIVWIRGDRIVGIAAGVPAPERPDAPNPARVASRELIDLVLEVPAGYAAANGWRRGDLVTLSGGSEARAH